MSHPADVWAEKIRRATHRKDWRFCRGQDLRALMGPTDGMAAPMVEARAQKAALVWLKNKVVADLSVNQRFLDATGVPWMDKLLKAARVKELAGVKIAKAGKSSGLRYDIAGLQATFYGRRILESLGFGRRRTSVDKEEYARIAQAFRKINLELPQTVSPTTTERFFAGELDA